MAPFVCLLSGDFRPRGMRGAGAWLATEPGVLQCVTCKAFPRCRHSEAPGLCVWGGVRAWGLGDRCRPGRSPRPSPPPSHLVLVVPTPASALDTAGTRSPQECSVGSSLSGPLRPLLFVATLRTVRGRSGKQRPSPPPRPRPPQVRAFLQPPLKGVVTETFGSGNGPTKPDLLQELRAAAERGLIILNCTHCLQGSVTSHYAAGMVGWRTRPGEAGDRPGGTGPPGLGAHNPPPTHGPSSQAAAGAGIVSGFDMTSEAPLAKLSYVLGRPGLSVDGRKEVCAPLAVGYVSWDQGRAGGGDSGRQWGLVQEWGGGRGMGLLMVQRANFGA